MQPILRIWLLVLAIAAPAAADLISSGEACVAPTNAVPFQCSQSVSASTITTTVLTAGTGSATVSSSNQSGYGVLRSQAAASFTGSSTPELIYVNGAANFSDQITINFAPFTGSLGYLILGFTLDGTVAQSGSLNAESYVDAFVGSGFGALNFTSSTAGTFFFPETFTFTYGTPFNLFFNLGTLAGTFNPGPTAGSIFPLTATAPGSGDSDFSNTLVLTALDVVDSQGNPVNGVTFASQSGTPYSVNGVVPEPTTVLLLGSTIFALALLRFRHSNRDPLHDLLRYFSVRQP
jgi:hypothetical protein